MKHDSDIDNTSETRRRLTPISAGEKGAPGEGGRCYLLVLEGGSSSLFHLPQTGVVLIGRGSETQLRLQDASVSRRHAKLTMADGQPTLSDLESSNGTRLNGEPVTGRASFSLRSGDVIAVGDVILVFHGGAGGRQGARRVLVEQGVLLRRLEEEIERALRYERPLALLAVLFPSGDKGERRAVGQALCSRLGPVDLCSLSGDGQALVLLPELPADLVAHKAQELVAALAAVAPQGRLGFATCPEDGCDADTLLLAARSAAAAAMAEDRRVAAARDSVTRLELKDRTIVLADPAMVRLFELIRRLSQSDLPVLISGETGVGKENAAFAVHHFSPRGKGRGPFVTLNCAALAETLVENELFGHEKGAFSGAVSGKPGLIESGSGGTIFLDEVGELSPAVQAKLLRVLESRRVTRLGDVREREVDIRIVAATNRDLEQEVQKGGFRRDLFFRLSAANVILPPLRERPREIPILARTFLDRACEQARRPPMMLSAATLHRLTTYGWPGNVRELRNTMDYVAAAVTEDTVEPWHLPERIGSPPEDQEEEPAAAEMAPSQPTPQPRSGRSFRPLQEELRDLERTRMAEALAASGGIKKHAAELLGVPLRTFTMKCKQYGLG